MKEITCQMCNGLGYVPIYTYITDHFGKQHLVETDLTCIECGGSGKVFITGEEE